MFEEILVILMGVIAGIITGLVPGIHINLVAIFIFSNFIFFSEFLSKELFILFIIVMGVVHSFLDFIPSILFGTANSDTSLSILPGHKLLMQGKGYVAIFYSAVGSLAGAFLAIFLSGFLFVFLDRIYLFFEKILIYFLALIIIYFILTEKDISKKIWASLIVLFSGGLGMLVLNSNFLKEPLLVLFTGTFAIPSILFAIKNEIKIPKQEFKVNFKLNSGVLKGLFISAISSTICAFSPGVGSAQAATISSAFLKEIQSRVFILILSSINTINFILSFITYYIIDRARNGSFYVISQLNFKFTIESILYFFNIILIISAISFFLTLIIGKSFIKKIERFNFKKLNIFILTFLLFLCFYISGIYGILILISATCLGILTIVFELKRVHLMNVLIIPIIFSII